MGQRVFPQEQALLRKPAPSPGRLRDMLSQMDIGNAADVSLTIAKVDKLLLSQEVQEQIGDRPVVELSVKISGNTVSWSSHTSKVKVSVPYTPSAEELQSLEHITVWYLDGSGNTISVPCGRYDPDTGMVTFVTNHFSAYAVAYVKKIFTDLEVYPWAQREISVLVSKGIIKGGQDRYASDANITRADFLVLLVRTLELSVEQADDNFNDVNPLDYYYKELGIAKKLGIAKGVGNNQFNPREPITRQDMMALASRAMKMAGRLEPTEDLTVLDVFEDKTAIASYAKDSIAALVEAGLIKGSNNRINPMENATRAEIAVMMYRIYNLE